MKLVYWMFKILVLPLLMFIGINFMKTAGWWALIMTVSIFVLVNWLLDRKINQYNHQYFLNKFPVLEGLKYGQIISVELLNGKVLENRIFASALSSEILIGSEPVSDNQLEDFLNGIKKTQWIRLKKVKSITIIK
ncbi:hypothetical protein RCG24_12230 [Neobacillus sp. OS1-32]|jgi:hypothetical protein|uniref:hypothetical protein n=1 Tax=Neobacillus sp. OS1-32 TaxID=3070682 RepID=UPI0027E177EA|nr:hypothetical protein [Neobacillus sp. OS1-32]WML28797.1 hypothetical protein RCG24_12230 [Neobacillus sp. OS1-32]